MFVALSVAEPAGRCERRKRKRNAPLTVERIAVPGAFSFYRMTVQTNSRQLPWNAIAEAAGSLRGCFLLPPGLTVPPECRVRAFVPQVLPQFLLFNFGVFVLNRRGVRKADLTVVDPQALFADRLERLLPFAATLRVLTARPACYSSTRRRLLELCGLTVCVAPLYAPLPEHGVLLSLSAARVPRLFDGLLFTNENRRLLRGETVVGKDVLLPPRIEALRPPGIDRVQFASALFERCGAEELQSVRFSNH